MRAVAGNDEVSANYLACGPRGRWLRLTRLADAHRAAGRPVAAPLPPPSPSGQTAAPPRS